MVQFLSVFFLGFLQFLLGFSKVPVFLCHSVHREQLIFILKAGKHFSLQPVKHCCRDKEKNKSS